MRQDRVRKLLGDVRAGKVSVERASMQLRAWACARSERPLGRTRQDVECHYLLMVATRSEREALAKVASERGLPCEERAGRFAKYLDLGQVGSGRVLGLRVSEGPFGYQGSAAQAILAQLETRAVGGVIAVGMCFGVDRERQAVGDVVVSSALVPYDDRRVDSKDRLPRPRYLGKRYPAKNSLVELFRRTPAPPERNVHVGPMLTGAAHIECGAYRDHLVAAHLKVAQETIVGGDMEGAGLLSLSPPDSPQWCLVKGICDFADEAREREAPNNRVLACEVAASFILDALQAEALPRPARAPGGEGGSVSTGSSERGP